MNYKLQILLGFLIFLTACKKESIEPDEMSEVPVFSVTGTVDGQPVSFYAGVDGAYLTTYTSDWNGVDCFSGKLTKGTDFADFGLFDGNVLSSVDFIPELGSNFYLTLPYSTPLLYIDKFQFSNETEIAEISIKVNGEEKGGALTIYEPGIYSICINVTFADASSSSMEICNDVVLGYIDDATFVLNHSSIGGQIQASIDQTENVNSIQWYLDGNLVSSTSNLDYSIAPGLHQLTAIVTYTNGIVRSRKIIVDGNSEGRFLEDIHLFKNLIPEYLNQDYKGRFDVKVNGVLYTHIGDPNNTSLEVTGIAPYGKNSAGKDVYKVSGNLTTQMKNTVNQSIVDAQFSIVIGVEIE